MSLAEYGVKLERSAPLALDRHESAPNEDAFASWCSDEKSAGRPLALDLFSGAGGLGLGVQAAGWTVVAAVDHDRRALETHQANFPGLAIHKDMSDPEQVRELISQLREIDLDLIVGGPPCQPFSRAGRAKIRSLVNQGAREEDDHRRELWRSFVDVVLALRPRAVIMENVPDMAIGDDLLVIRTIADILERSGYSVDYRLLDAWRHGVPQHRKRFILQARKDGAPRWPEPQSDRVNVRDAISDLPKLGATTGARELPYVGEALSEFARQLRGDAGPLVFDHMTRPVRSDDREAFELMTPRTLYSDLPEHLRRYRSDTFNDKYKRLDWDDLSRTITAHIAKDGYWYIHPGEHRTLTVREAARIQTFPDSFRFSGTRSDAFRQIGNAVPPMLGKAVAEAATDREGSAPVAHVEISALRNGLTNWAMHDRETFWWRYPGHRMTPMASALAALLDVQRLSPDLARAIMTPIGSQSSLGLEQLTALPTDRLSRGRRILVRGLRESVRRTDAPATPDDLLEHMRPSQRRVMSILQGGPELVVNAHVGKAVTTLMRLPSHLRGLHTDVKVAAAQLVGVGENAALRMCALRHVDIAAAPRIRAESEF